ncbi:VCBS domain-containing protein [Noviherbaspirillum sp. ST9]|uniref:VCBS domain-containing protein n=1 Tax=Noviherbaspirillum sp. ST9 TaxID=3401606 RepID=UPI003B586F8F
MAASTTVKVATLTGAAKDDNLTAATTGLTEDNLSAKLNVLANDPGAAKLYSLTQNTSGYASTAQFPVVTSVTLASGAKITMNADGTVGYDASALQSTLQAYAAGETFTDTFVYTVRMANGALSTAKVTVAIAGANDAPTLAGVTPVSILDTAADDTPAAVTGALAGADMDHGAVLTYGFADGVDYTVIDGKLVSTNAYGTLTLDAQTGNYSFVADADKIDALGAGAFADASFAVKVSDEHGASAAPVTLRFDLVGANDTAAISGTNGGDVSEDATLVAGDTLAVADLDAGEAAFAAPVGLEGQFGTFTFDAATGAWTYTLNNDDADVQALGAGKVEFDELTVTSLDGTDSEIIRVNVAGTNDIATFGGDTTGSVAEDGIGTASGTLSTSDTDAGETGFGSVGNLEGTYGTFTFDATNGAWTYNLRNGDANVQALTGADTKFDELVITSLDGSAYETIRVSIAGADEPVTITLPPVQAPAQEPVSTVVAYKVNHGQTDVNGKQIILNFDADDQLTYANNYIFKGITLVDTDNDGIKDSSQAAFDFKHGKEIDPVTVVLVGYADLTTAQILGA